MFGEIIKIYGLFTPWRHQKTERLSDVLGGIELSSSLNITDQKTIWNVTDFGRTSSSFSFTYIFL